MHRRNAPALVATGLAWGTASPAFASCKVPRRAELAFRKPVFIDKRLEGGGPTSVVAHHGTIVVGAHLGSTLINPKTVPDPNWVQNYRNQTLVWRSQNDGSTTWPQADAVADSGDRSWLAARGNGVVYGRITGNLQKSTDGGRTWKALTDPPNGYSQLMTDPTIRRA
jgi:hypothetical protein